MVLVDRFIGGSDKAEIRDVVSGHSDQNSDEVECSFDKSASVINGIYPKAKFFNGHIFFKFSISREVVLSNKAEV